MTAFEETQQRRLIDRRQRLPDTPEGRHAAGEIEDALARIEAGQYGRCESCDGPIGRSRLVALPEARRCLGCDSQRPDPSTAGSPAPYA